MITERGDCAEKDGLKAARIGCEVHRHEEVSSTNDLAIELASIGRPEGTVVVAGCQVRGRGRRGRSWHSPPGKNLYLSILLRPRRAHEEWQQLSWVVAGAVARTLMEYGIRDGLTLKCPNDLLVRGRKISGVLLESRTGSGHAPCVVAGIGLNVNLAEGDLPDDLAGQATSLAMETGREHDLEDLLRRLLSGIGELYESWLRHGGADIRRILEVEGVSFMNFTDRQGSSEKREACDNLLRGVKEGG